MINQYQSPLGSRYGKEIGSIFSDEFKFKTWRRCWIALAESELELQIAGITAEQVEELKIFAKNINYDEARRIEKETRHDVMAHIHAYGLQCPQTKGIIHAGATSCDITDNTDLIQMYEGLKVLKIKLVNVIFNLRNFSEQYKDLPILGYTHMQPAQPTTLGKRAAGWNQDLVMNYNELERIIREYRIRGLKGATGTQASFLELTNGNEELVLELNRRFNQKLGFELEFDLTTQTYPRSYDSFILKALESIGESAHKFGTDFRLMQSRRELEEPFEKTQVGSSAMPYKRNPMRTERMCSLARLLQGFALMAMNTSIIQWHERTLDDSAGRRVYIPQSFIATDEVLNLYLNVFERINVYPKMIKTNLEREIPFLIAEQIIMRALKKGKDRQMIHERIRLHSNKALESIREGNKNNLLDLIETDSELGITKTELDEMCDPNNLTGLANQQVTRFNNKIVDSILEREKELLGKKSILEI